MQDFLKNLSLLNIIFNMYKLFKGHMLSFEQKKDNVSVRHITNMLVLPQNSESYLSYFLLKNKLQQEGNNSFIFLQD